MHYIVGTQIFIHPQGLTVQAEDSPLHALNMPKPQRLVKSSTPLHPFETGKAYILQSIRCTDGSYTYVFGVADGITEEMVIVEFEFTSVRAAEQAIAAAKGENVPDYTEFHKFKGG